VNARPLATFDVLLAVESRTAKDLLLDRIVDTDMLELRKDGWERVDPRVEIVSICVMRVTLR
jgi:hypothetical protein